MTIGQPLFVRWCKLMGDESLAEDPRFKDDLARGDNGEALSAHHAEMVRRADGRGGARRARGQPHPGRPGLHAAADARRPACARTPKFFHQMDYPRRRPSRCPVLQEPVKLSRTPLTIRRRAPTLGEHTDQILKELGYEPGRDREAAGRSGRLTELSASGSGEDR